MAMICLGENNIMIYVHDDFCCHREPSDASNILEQLGTLVSRAYLRVSTTSHQSGKSNE